MLLAAREAARDLYDELDLPSALLRLAKSRPKGAGNIDQDAVARYLKANGKPRTFDQFIAAYNDLLDSMDGPPNSARSGRGSYTSADPCRVSHAWKAKEEPGTWSDKMIAVVPDEDTVPDVQARRVAARARRVVALRVRD